MHTMWGGKTRYRWEQTSNKVRIFSKIKQRPRCNIGFDWFSFPFYTSFVAEQQIFSNELNMIQCIAWLHYFSAFIRHLSTKKLAESCATVALIVEKSYGRVPGQLIQSSNTDASLKMLGFSSAFAAIVWMNYAFGLLITTHTQIQSEKSARTVKALREPLRYNLWISTNSRWRVQLP